MKVSQVFGAFNLDMGCPRIIYVYPVYHISSNYILTLRIYVTVSPPSELPYIQINQMRLNVPVVWILWV